MPPDPLETGAGKKVTKKMPLRRVIALVTPDIEGRRSSEILTNEFRNTLAVREARGDGNGIESGDGRK
jgi:hypothetical protein